MTLKFENVPAELEQALRKRAETENKTLDAAAFDAMARGLGLMPQNNTKKRDLSFLAAGPPLEPEVIRALEEQRQIDIELWQ